MGEMKLEHTINDIEPISEKERQQQRFIDMCNIILSMPEVKFSINPEGKEVGIYVKLSPNDKLVSLRYFNSLLLEEMEKYALGETFGTRY